MNRKYGYIWILLVLLLMSVVPVGAQTLKDADRHFSGGAYHSAATMYRQILSTQGKTSEVKKKRSEILFKVAECYRRMNKITDANRWYKQAQGAGYDEANLWYGLGNIQLLEGKYEEAKQSFLLSQEKNPGDERLAAKISSCEVYKLYGRSSPQHDVRPVESLNTRGSEYGLSFYGDKLIFASTGIGSSKTKKISERTGLPYSDLYTASPDAKKTYGRITKIESLSSEKANEGTFCYDAQADQLYFTRCEGKNCYIFKVNVDGDKYKESGKLKLGNQTYGIGHPFITEDGSRIYFTSTMDGGYGGADLWYVDKEGDSYGEPVNLGPEINTAGNEVFPSFYDGVLYFSSDGHPGLGGLDIFTSYLEGNGSFGKPINLRAPFNSSWDDFNLIINPKGENGFFVSNRNNAVSSDDIYMFDALPTKAISLVGNVYDDETKEILPEYTITVKEDGKKILEQAFNDGNDYFLRVAGDKSYEVTASAIGLTKAATISTLGISPFSELRQDFYMGKEKKKPVEVDSKEEEDFLDGLNIDDLASMMAIEMRIIFYEFDKFRLTDEARAELDKYVRYFRDYPGLVVEIGSHTDVRGSRRYNQKLSEFRAKAVVDYFVSRGISSNRIVWKGYGKDQLLVPNARTEAEHRSNRRTVFKVLTLGQDAKKNIVVKHISAKEMLNAGTGNTSDLSGYWVQVHSSSNPNELGLPVVRQAVRATGKEVKLIRDDDGVSRYCIQYSTRKDAINAQVSLRKENINSMLLQF